MTNLQSWNKYCEGMKCEWAFSFSEKEMLKFAKLSGDYNPIHTDLDFAKSKGFDSTITYGLLLSTQMSRLIGEELPDKNAVLTSIQIDFMKPSHPQDKLIFEANLVNKSDSTKALEFKCNILRNQKILCRGIVNAIWIP